jgi:hypothetical protein
MKLAILGTDPDIVHIAAAARRQGHEFVWIGDIRPNEASQISQLAPGLADRANEWELLLGRGVVDAVLIGAGNANEELRIDRVKRLVVEGVPVLIVLPPFDSVLPYYEVDMIRRESRGIVQHYNRLVGPPVSKDVNDWLRHGHPTLGQIHQFSCERRVAAASRHEVLTHLARDAELLAGVAGDIRRVTAIGPADRDSSFASLQIQMVADAAASLRWSIGSAAAAETGLELSLLGENGIATLNILDASERPAPKWRLELAVDGDLTEQPLVEFDPATAAIERLAGAATESEATRRADASTWDAATRAMEVVDAVELSLQKKRTIEVFQQQLTERLAFRGTMAALGCGLLLLAFFGVIIVGMLQGAAGVAGQRLIPGWSLILLAVLAFFLLLQAVPLLARKSSGNATSATSDET